MKNIKTKIKGLEIIPLTLHQDDRGYLFEMIHYYDLPKEELLGDILEYKFGQVYFVHNPVRGTIRAFHKHKKLWDYFCIVNGSAKFAFEKDGIVEEIILSARKPQTIIVPPEVYHGWMSLEDNTILASVGSEIYNQKNPDEERIPFDSFGYDWSINYK